MYAKFSFFCVCVFSLLYNLSRKSGILNNFAEIASSVMYEIHKIFTKVIEYFFFFYKIDSWWGHELKE